MIEINLDNYDKNKMKQLLVLSGRELGYKMRKHFEFNLKDVDEEKYLVIFPSNIIAISTSFFLALFGESVRTLGSSDKFKDKYTFSTNENINLNILDGITDALNNVDGLSE